MSDRDRNEQPDAAQFPVGGGVVSPNNPHGEDPMTDVQAAELRQLCDKTGEPFDGNLTQDQAAARIDALRDG